MNQSSREPDRFRFIRRAANGLRKVAAGLRPFNESVWPGVRNDLFVAHESIYHFFSRFSYDKSVLDAGCGTGYGAIHLARSDARSVTGIDIDPLSIRYARRHFVANNLEFCVGNLQSLLFADRSFELVVASNALEHLRMPTLFLHDLHRVLTTDGTAMIAVPPILSAQDLSVHANIHYHRSNLTVDDWLELFRDSNFEVECYSHRAFRDVAPHFESPRSSALSVSDFEFVATTRDGFYSRPSITAIFALKVAPAKWESVDARASGTAAAETGRRSR